MSTSTHYLMWNTDHVTSTNEFSLLPWHWNCEWNHSEQSSIVRARSVKFVINLKKNKLQFEKPFHYFKLTGTNSIDIEETR